MRSVLRHIRYTGLSLVLVILLSTLSSACAGSSSSNNAASSGTTNTIAVAANPGGSTPAGGSQAQDEPLAARVNGEPITLAAFQRERERRAMGLDIQPATAASFDAQVLDAMIDEVLMRQAAVQYDITVTDADVDAELAVQSDLAAANGQSLDTIVSAQLYTMDEYGEVIRTMLIAQKLSDVVADVSPYSEQVHARHILVADEATARSLIAQIQAGADFAALATQYSLDPSTARIGGDLDWVSEGDLLQPEVEAAIFALQPGELDPEPVKSSLGYHVVQTLERVPDRPLSQAALAQKRQRAFITWLENQREQAVIERFVSTPGQ